LAAGPSGSHVCPVSSAADSIDTPTGATIVVTFSAVLILMFLLHLIVHHGRNNHQLVGASSAKHELPH
jgi:hypothetical protein